MRILLLIALLTAWGHANPKTPDVIPIRIFTFPAGANITHTEVHLLGRSGNWIYLDKSTHAGTALVELDLSKPNFHRRVWEKRWGYLERYRTEGYTDLVFLWPKNLQGVLELVGTGLLTLGVLAGLPLSLVAIRQLRKHRELRRREELLSAVQTVDSLSTKVIGSFRLFERLGRGGMGSVYRALPEATLKPEEAVAVKVLHKSVTGGADALERFRREAKVTAQLDHPHIVRLLDFGEHGELVYLVMELMEGGTLRDRMGADPIRANEVWDVIRPLCQAVTYAHDKGIVHRDLKPENILFTSGGLLKVADFGLARALDQDKITATGMALGTPAYMCPGQIQGEKPNQGFDQFAIGTICYELLTGRLPLQGEDPVQQIYVQLAEQPAPPSTWVSVSDEVDGVLMKMLSKQTAAQYPSVAEAADALERALLGL